MQQVLPFQRHSVTGKHPAAGSARAVHSRTLAAAHIQAHALLQRRRAASAPHGSARLGSPAWTHKPSRWRLHTCCQSKDGAPAAQGVQDASSSSNGNGNGRRVVGLTGRERLGGAPGPSNGNAGRVAGQLVPTDDGFGGGPPRSGNGDGGRGDGDRDDQSEGGGAWKTVLSIAAAAVAMVAASRWFRDRDSQDAPRKRPVREDVAALKRLLREAFAELTDQGGRLHALEQRGPAKGGGGWTVGADLAPSRAADITFVGAIETAPALVMTQAGSAEALRAACATPDDAGGGGGPLLRGQLRSEARGGADEVAAEVLLPCGSTAGNGGLAPMLQKVVYSLGAEADAERKWRLLLGRGRGDDVAATLNPAAGRGLTHLLRHGCALHQRTAGSGVGLALRGGGRLHAAAAHLVSGDAGGRPGWGSSLAQATVAVTEACSVGLVALRQQRQDSGRQDAGDSCGGWRLEGQLGDVALPLQGGQSAAVQQAVATTGTVDVRQAALLSWWAAQSTGSSSSSRSGGAATGHLEFGVSVASHPLKGPGGWVLAVGRSRGPQLPAALAAAGAASRNDHSADASGASSAVASPGATAGGDGGGGNGSAAAADSAPDPAAGSADPGTSHAGQSSSLRGASNATSGPGSVAHERSSAADSAPWIAEASLQIPMGEGLAVTPGVVAVRSNGASTIALAARMQWAF